MLGAASSAEIPQRITAILVEAATLPACSGLDCPPWHLPNDVYFCFQVGDDFYSGVYESRGLPWLRGGEKLLAFKGKPVELFATNRKIRVVAPHINLHLKRVRQYPLFRLAACQKN
jgi:hypothetical protein